MSGLMAPPRIFDHLKEKAGLVRIEPFVKKLYISKGKKKGEGNETKNNVDCFYGAIVLCCFSGG